MTLGDTLSQNYLEKIQKGDPSFTECFKHLALGLRLFSFTAIEMVKVPEDPLPVPSDVVPESGACKEKLEETSTEQAVVASN